MRNIIFAIVISLIVITGGIYAALNIISAYRLAPENARNITEVAVYFAIVFTLLAAIAIGLLTDAVKSYRKNNH